MKLSLKKAIISAVVVLAGVSLFMPLASVFAVAAPLQTAPTAQQQAAANQAAAQRAAEQKADLDITSPERFEPTRAPASPQRHPRRGATGQRRTGRRRRTGSSSSRVGLGLRRRLPCVASRQGRRPDGRRWCCASWTPWMGRETTCTPWRGRGPPCG